MIHVVRAKDWIRLTLTGLFVAGSVWAVRAASQTKVSGRGALLRPRRVVFVQTLAGGRLEALPVHAGDVVRKRRFAGANGTSRTSQAHSG